MSDRVETKLALVMSEVDERLSRLMPRAVQFGRVEYPRQSVDGL